MKNIIYIAVAVILIVSCDKVSEPFIENTNNGPDTNTIVQKVLIEDFTGHRCGNCPRAHEKIEELHGIYGDKIIAIAIHSGYFAIPTADYPPDYRSTEGDALTSYYGVTDYPIGLVNRTEESGQKLMAYSAWSSAVGTILAQSPEMGITVTNTYNSDTSQLQSSAEIEFLADQPGQLKICFYITEDSIVSPQTDYNETPNKIDNYTHRHVLRGSMNGTFGENLPSATYSKGGSVTVTKSLTLNSNWESSHCSVVVYVYRESDEKILQVEEKKVQ